MNREKRSWIYDLLLVAVLALAAFLRLTGVEWGEGQHQHPDELFITGVTEGLRAHACRDAGVPIDACPQDHQRWMNPVEFFNTDTSTLNPNNRGAGFYVYGTLPLFIVRTSYEWLNWAQSALTPQFPALAGLVGDLALEPLKYFGRQLSALADLFAILILYFIVERLYNRRTALLAALFSSLAVMQIQQSHFYTVDSFMTPFMMLALYFAVRIAYDKPKVTTDSQADSDKVELVATETSIQVDTYTGTQVDTDDATRNTQPLSSDSPSSRKAIFHLSSLLRDPIIWYSILFGLALGMAAACKINAIVLAVALPGALAIRFSHQLSVISHQSSLNSDQPTDTQHATYHPVAERSGRNTFSSLITENWPLITACLIIGGLVTLLTFRIFQPYAFDGLLPNPHWIDSLRELRGQATGAADLPWNLQWIRRSHLYSFENLTTWGLGLPLGILAWAGFLFMGWRILKGERQHILLWAWTALYFGWQSLQFNPTMRYELPIYPLLCMMAAWLVFGVERLTFNVQRSTINLKPFIYVISAIVLALTAAWAFAFLSIYTHPETRMAASRWIYENIPGPITLKYADGTAQPLPFPTSTSIQNGSPYSTNFTAESDGLLTEVLLPHVNASALPTEFGATTNPFAPQTLRLSLLDRPDAPAEQALASSSVTSDFAVTGDLRGPSVSLTFDRPVEIKKGENYFLRLETTGAVTLAGANIANETDYDWSLPFRIDNYDPFGGLYRGDLNLQVYWDDNPDKVARFEDTLNQTDYIFIPTNHQYAQIPRVPERYPLTTVYYRELIGCPPDENILWCYRVAEPGMFQGRLGFTLVKTFESYPTLFGVSINDGAAEEAFTFYDHPKVLIFQKSADYDPMKVATTLGAVDLSNVVHLTPKEASSYKPPKSLMLPPDRLASQQAGGTWSQLFNYDWLQNKYPALGVVYWYLFIFLLGLFTYPLARRVLPGLTDKGYALSRVLGLVILAYVSWLMGSVGIAYTRGSIAAVCGGIALVGGWQAWVQREALAREWNSNRRMFLIIEGVFLVLFLIDLFIRLGNPDLWHPAKGGERPMDFSYFNAVLKSTSFPPYDPWFGGGYINYYYYGYVLVGTPVKLLGVVPSIAYNFILPTLFALVGIGAFAIGSNLVRRNTEHASLITDREAWSLITGLVSTFLMLLLGNLGTIRAVWMAFQTMAAPDGVVEGANIFQRFIWGLDGLAKTLTGVPLPIRQGDWYWLPSRVIPAPNDVEPITEFPLFTFLYSDLHAHMIVLMLTLFMIAWGLSYIVAIRAAGQMAGQTFKSLITEHWSLITFPILFGALVLGAIYPTNTWDAFTYIPLSAIAVGYALFNIVDFKDNRLKWPPMLLRLAFAGAGALTLVLLSRIFYEPYFYWFGTGYGQVDAWTGSHTPLTSYFTHWGVFLFMIFAWMVWETREWMASTPLSSLNKLKPYQLLIEFLLAAMIIALMYLLYRGAIISIIALPMAAWAAVLILRPGQSGAKRWVLFMIGTALALTIAVEVIVLVGDIGRMNTVFKLYLQAWTLLAVSAAAAFGWTLPAVPFWRERWKVLWQVGVTLLLAGAFLFTFTATWDKVHDRMNTDVPHTFDSMTYMATSTFWDSTTMDLGQDYRAIRWMQDNVQGSPVIVEGNCPEYRWCTRFTIYTGLPGVVGWNWHQRQQRGFVAPLIIENRIAEIADFYNTTDITSALAFLKKYNVRYIIVGQVENIYYPGAGLLKFEFYDGAYWKEVFRDGQTVIYEVNPLP
jgi:YYY domain-containing protein